MSEIMMITGKFKNLSAKYCLYAALACALALYLLCMRIFYVGFFTDDALFIVLAKSILQGSYAGIYSNTIIPLTDPLPGYPLLLAPFVAVFGVLPEIFQLLSISAVIFSGWLIYKIIEASDSRITALFGATFFCVNVSMVRFSGTVLSEPIFITAALSGVWLLSFDKKPAFYLSALLIGWTCIIRPQGIFLLASVLLLFLIRRDYKKFIIFFVIAIAPLTAFLIRNIVVAHEITGYASNIIRNVSTDFSVMLYLQNLKINMGMLFPGMIFEFGAPQHSLLRSIVAWGSITAGLCLILVGFFKNSRSTAVVVSLLYVCISFVSLPLWIAYDARYNLIVLPFALMLIGIGASWLYKSFWWGKLLTGLLVLVLVFNHFYGNFHNIKESISGYPKGGNFPQGTYSWIEENLVDGESVLSHKAPDIYIHTKKKSAGIEAVEDYNGFLFFLKENNIRYVHVHLGRYFSHLSPASLQYIMQKNIEDWVLHGRNFEPVYVNELEKQAIFEFVGLKNL